MVNGCGTVAHDGVVTAGHDGRHEAPQRPGIRGPDRVNAAMERKQPMTLDPPADLIRAEPRGQQLTASHDPMLPRRQTGDDLVRGHKLWVHIPYNL